MLNERLVADSAGNRYVGRLLDVSPLEGLVLSLDDGRYVRLPAETTTILSTGPERGPCS